MNTTKEHKDSLKGYTYSWIDFVSSNEEKVSYLANELKQKCGGIEKIHLHSAPTMGVTSKEWQIGQI